MNLEIAGGHMCIGTAPRCESEITSARNQAGRHDHGQQQSVPMDRVEEAIADLNQAKEDGEVEFFEKKGVVHVRINERPRSLEER